MSLHAQAILCSAAEVDPGGRVHMLGAGTELLPITDAAHTVVVRVRADGNDASTAHRTALRLLSADGTPVRVARQAQSPGDPASIGLSTVAPVEITGEFPAIADSPDALPPWGWVSFPLIYAIGPGTLSQPGGYRWEFAADGRALADAPLYVLSTEEMAALQAAQGAQ
jgi:hypothetical protein